MFSSRPVKIWIAGVLLIAIPVILFFDRLYALHFQHIQLHSTIETFGGITVCLISLMLYLESQASLNAQLIMLATGFAAMGILDISHAISKPGDSFIFLHSVGSLFGGFFFASVWFTHGRRMRNLFELRFIYFGFAILSASVGLRALLFPGDVPRILPLYDEGFTVIAVLINLTASFLFFLSMMKFYKIYRQSGAKRDLLFVYLSCLFGIAELIFPFSSPWNGMWWVWHLVRLTAFTATLVFVFRRYRRRLNEDGFGAGERGES
ncbi:hypothetical protein SAMN02745216_01223 [Desulfatibacillum alkenivorans DSM 16219]|jgi:hypothetical protein|uniref:Membrane-associated sensor domain-containing protein n=1 Tax=Desulfatibacillum alkenivorans DSM 16219 TaxID=1121393 RepID=A0A1M6HH78_9BACT|nr:MASE3 domain-containing protein [Desulfatibacillum alkenivorans]SHJ21504.1 hypothetical protein SAMN02745216_01223 [Desulfatibacillum alkenivorans DSM 16219]